MTMETTIVEPTEPTTLPALVERMENITSDLTQDQVCAAIMLLSYAKEKLRLAEAAMKAGTQMWMEANQVHEMSIGTVKYYVGYDKETKCLSVRNAIEALLEVTGGDVDAICDCLSSNALKPGATKKALPPEKYEELFETTNKMKLHVSDSKPKPTGEKTAVRELLSIDTKFVR